MGAKKTSSALVLLVLCTIALANPSATIGDTRSSIWSIVRQDDSRTDGLIGICPADLLLPISKCFCYGIFTKMFKTAVPSQVDTRAECIIFVGPRAEILANKDYCIPYLTSNDKIRKRMIVRDLNRLLRVCERDQQISLK